MALQGVMVLEWQLILEGSHGTGRALQEASYFTSGQVPGASELPHPEGYNRHGNLYSHWNITAGKTLYLHGVLERHCSVCGGIIIPHHCSGHWNGASVCVLHWALTWG